MTETRIPEVIGAPEFPTPKDLKIPKWLMAKVLKTSNGRKRDPMAVSWFFRFMETGQATQSVIDVGWKGKSTPSWKAYHYKQHFAEVLPHAIMFQRQSMEPKALRLLDYVMDQAMDPKNADKPQMLAVGVKASGVILDRGDMPRGAKIHGLDTAPREEKVERSGHEMIDKLVETVGIEAVRQMRGIADYKAHRDYLESKWPLVLT